MAPLTNRSKRGASNLACVARDDPWYSPASHAVWRVARAPRAAAAAWCSRKAHTKRSEASPGSCPWTTGRHTLEARGRRRCPCSDDRARTDGTLTSVKGWVDASSRLFLAAANGGKGVFFYVSIKIVPFASSSSSRRRGCRTSFFVLTTTRREMRSARVLDLRVNASSASASYDARGSRRTR